ncbi:MAG TPA: NAD(P)-binding domain-containing protein [Verrucomicrobiae bacterium]|nr:NAD(P)-binding domain-containing protein [Verrucomicrobiae bacterium]
MKIGILGSGTVARTLGKAWAAKGHEICIGARNPAQEAIVAWQQTIGPKARVGSLQDAAAFGEVILIAINPWTEIEGAVTPLALELESKTIIDVSNNTDFGKVPPKMAFTDRSMGESIQSWLPESNVVKTLNITPAGMMINPGESGITPAVGWVSGNNEGAKQQVAALLKDIGWTEVTDLGDIHQSILQESIGLTLSIIVTGAMAQKG